MKYLSLLTLGLLMACSSDDVELPVCMEPIFEDYKVIACKGSGDLTTWMFNGELVYCFVYGDCISDSGAYIYNDQCVELCYLGGLLGNTECQGLDWDSNAVYVATLYEQ
jgi:hypothetical protein